MRVLRHTVLPPAASPHAAVFGGRDQGRAGSRCHGNHGGQPVCVHEGSGVHCRQQSSGTQGDGADGRVQGEHMHVVARACSGPCVHVCICLV